MLSNQKHINRSNYEEFFLLYVDNELTKEERSEVEAFLLLHPDLQDELEVLMSTTLDAESISFDKESLFADSMKQNYMEESLLLYLDNELPEAEKKSLETELNTNPCLKAEYHMLQQAKLDANETIVYPNKKELYRHTTRSIRPVFMMRAAAAILIMLTAGVIFWTSNDATKPDSIADGTPNINNTTVVASTPADPTPTEANLAEVKTEENTVGENAIASNERRIVAEHAVIRTNETKTEQQPVENIAVVQHIAMNEPKEITTTPIEIETTSPVTQQIINTQPVTTETAAAYNPIEASISTTDVKFTEEKKGSVRGFFRKASRFIENRTGINPVNEDEELLIGAIAIKLK